jgi:hypothetical protein
MMWMWIAAGWAYLKLGIDLYAMESSRCRIGNYCSSDSGSISCSGKRGLQGEKGAVGSKFYPNPVD